MLALWASWRWQSGKAGGRDHGGWRWRWTTLFMFTQRLFALCVALIVLLRARYSLRRRFGYDDRRDRGGGMLVVRSAIADARGDLFSIALGWLAAAPAARTRAVARTWRCWQRS